MRKMSLALAAIMATTLVAGCSGGSTAPSGQEQENVSRQSNYDRLTKNQPAHTMDYSPTRATKNFWIDTWGHKGKLSYVYMQNGEGKVTGYYVLEGLPVSYCVSLIPPYQFVKGDGGEYYQDYVVPGPSVDGTFASSSNCNAFYGKDAVSGAYIEYFAGFGNNPMIFDQPMPQYGDAKPLGDARISEVKQK